MFLPWCITKKPKDSLGGLVLFYHEDPGIAQVPRLGRKYLCSTNQQVALKHVWKANTEVLILTTGNAEAGEWKGQGNLIETLYFDK